MQNRNPKTKPRKKNNNNSKDFQMRTQKTHLRI